MYIKTANYTLEKINNSDKKIIIAFTDDWRDSKKEIVATFETLKAAEHYCLNQNEDLSEQIFFADEISVFEFNQSIPILK